MRDHCASGRCLGEYDVDSGMCKCPCASCARIIFSKEKIEELQAEERRDEVRRKDWVARLDAQELGFDPNDEEDYDL